MSFFPSALPLPPLHFPILVLPSLLSYYSRDSVNSDEMQKLTLTLRNRYIATEMSIGSEGASGWMKVWQDRTPLGRFADPKEISGSLLMLAAPQMTFMTGSDVVVDGGCTSLSSSPSLFLPLGRIERRSLGFEFGC